MSATLGPGIAAARPRRLPDPNWVATLMFIAGLVLTGLTTPGESPSAVARHAAVGVGVSLVMLIGLEFWNNRAALLRADMVCMAALYYLIFAEFLVGQPDFDTLAQNHVVVTRAVEVILCGMGAMALGRHLVGRSTRTWGSITVVLPKSAIVALFWASFALGFFHMLLAVGFDPVELVRNFLLPRFAVAWGRPQFGDIGALLYELGATIFLVPPLGGLILGRRRRFRISVVVPVFFALVFTLFYGFTTGTRSVMGAFLITFLVAYFYAVGSARRVLPVAIAVAMVMLASTVYGLEFRNVGLGAYLEGERDGADESGFYVDYNLLTISQLVDTFPTTFPYLGWEVPLWLLVRVVPRALWAGKPTGESISAQTYLGIPEGTTVSSTFIGEAYMGGGILGVMLVGLILGFLATWWTRKTFAPSADLAILFYGSGFFAVVTTMRSMYMLPVALMPVLALAGLTWFLLRRMRRRPAG